ncbi:MAG TPA: pyridoxal-dependent decarboxylase, partial [Gemmatimonadales bacterium]|nr:pyridoxal-dependent decarboxylase [Gemmatimonadales bacterium]
MRPTRSGRRDRAAFAQALERHHRATPRHQALDLEGPGTTSLAAWFLGPKAENQRTLLNLVTQAIRTHGQERRDYYPGDPAWVTPRVKQSKAYREGLASLEQHFRRLVGRLRGSVPFYSYRYQAHMLWDFTLPSLVGYIAALLYNQNNVAAEASPVTTLLEMQVGNDLCAMLGYKVPRRPSSGTIVPWGHITCDGSMANIESMWAARNLKFYALGLARALAAEPSLAAGCNITVRGLDGTVRRLLDLDPWALLNLGADEVLALPGRLASECGIDSAAVDAAMQDYTVQGLGMAGFRRRFLGGATPEPCVLGPATMHYSWPKAAALLGLGEINLHRIHVDLDGRLELALVREHLERSLATKRPVVMAVAVLGSTEESAVDPLADLVALRKTYRARGLNFYIHCDAAWGGYFASLLRRPAGRERVAGGDHHTRHFVPEMALSRYVTRQLQALQHADSITVDPHKAGCVPYPAGALCYRNSAMRSLVSLKAPVVYHGGVDPTVGVYGVEGSKPGAAAAAVYLSHRVIRADRSGYGRLLGKCAFNSARFYAALVTLATDDDPFIVVPFQRLP